MFDPLNEAKEMDDNIDELRDFYEQWEDILIWFEWDKVQSAMSCLDWRWASLGAVPEKEDLVNAAKKLCQCAYDKRCRVGSGGFYAQREDGCLSLCFVLESWSTGMYDDEAD